MSVCLLPSRESPSLLAEWKSSEYYPLTEYLWGDITLADPQRGGMIERFIASKYKYDPDVYLWALEYVKMEASDYIIEAPEGYRPFDPECMENAKETIRMIDSVQEQFNYDDIVDMGKLQTICESIFSRERKLKVVIYISNR